MSTTRELMSALRSRLGCAAPLPPPPRASAVEPPPPRVFPTPATRNGFAQAASLGVEKHGQQANSVKHLTIRDFLDELFEDMVRFDTRLVRTLQDVVALHTRISGRCLRPLGRWLLPLLKLTVNRWVVHIWKRLIVRQKAA